MNLHNMGNNIKGVNIPSRIVPYSPNDTYPTHEAIYGKGGWKCVQNVKDLATIPVDRLETGCIVRVNLPSAIEYSFVAGNRASDEELSGIDLEKNPTEENIAKFGFVKWTPGYQPKSLSELKNDVPFVAEVVEKTIDGDFIYLNPDDSEDNIKIQNELLGRTKGIYQEMAISYLYRNSYSSNISDDYGKPVYGLVTVDSEGKIPSDLVEDGGKYVERLVGFFPDDWITPGDDSAYDKPKPDNMVAGQKYYVTSNYLKNRDPEDEDVLKFRNQICVATNDTGADKTWVAQPPITEDFLYINEGTQSLYIFGKNYINEPKCVGREIIRDINTLKDASVAETKWNEYSVSAKVIYELLKDSTTGSNEVNKVLLSQLTNVDMTCTPSFVEKPGQNEDISVKWNITYNNKRLIPKTLKLVSTTQGEPISTDTNATSATVNVPTSFRDDKITLTLTITMEYGASKVVTKTINTYYPCYFGNSSLSTGNWADAIKLTKQVLESPKGTYSMNVTEGNYVWLYVPSEMTINEVISNGVKVPFLDKAEISGEKGVYNGYRSVEKFKAGTFNYTIS